MTLENISEKNAVHCKTNLTSCCVGHNLSNWFFPMELELLKMLSGGISIEIESRWWYLCIAEEVERMGSIVVRYLIQGMCYRPYTLECTTPVLVSDIVHRAAVPNIRSKCSDLQDFDIVLFCGFSLCNAFCQTTELFTGSLIVGIILHVPFLAIRHVMLSYVV